MRGKKDANGKREKNKFDAQTLSKIFLSNESEKNERKF